MRYQKPVEIAANVDEMPEGTDHIGVCVCTYKRSHMLPQLLEQLQIQKTEDRFRYSLHFVDNDPLKSAERVVVDISRNAKIQVFVQAQD